MTCSKLAPSVDWFVLFVLDRGFADAYHNANFYFSGVCAVRARYGANPVRCLDDWRELSCTAA